MLNIKSVIVITFFATTMPSIQDFTKDHTFCYVSCLCINKVASPFTKKKMFKKVFITSEICQIAEESLPNPNQPTLTNNAISHTFTTHHIITLLPQIGTPCTTEFPDDAAFSVAIFEVRKGYWCSLPLLALGTENSAL